MEKELALIFDKITRKSTFMVTLNIPPRFKRKDPTSSKEGSFKLLKAPSQFESVPESSVDW